MRLLRHVPLVAVAICAHGNAAIAQAPDLVVTNARIYTVDANRPVVEAMAIRAGRIVATGPRTLIEPMKGPETRVLDAHGRTIIPGMVDAHAHLATLGRALRTVDLVGTTSYAQIVDRVSARAREVPAGTWIVGRGWDQNDWADTRFPTHDALSRALPGHPVVLERVDGHAILANAAAMSAAGVTAATRDPAGGRLERSADGRPTGVFVDNASVLVERVIPPPSREEVRNGILAAIKEANRWGLTGIHDAGVPRDIIDVFEELAREGKYDLRNYVMVSGDDSTISHYLQRGPQNGLYDGRLWIRSIKLSADGALGSRGAALLEPYSDDATNSGLATLPAGRVHDVAVKALGRGFQVNVHAIGDRANRTVLDEFEQALKEVPTVEHRFRIEHAQIVHPDDLPRFAELGVIPSMQASHQTSDMYWAANRIGPARLLGAYAWRTLLNTGVVIPNGSDFPVEQVNPLISFHASVSRQDARNWPTGGWYPEQRMTREEALKSMTLWAAYAAFMDKETGSLEPGKYADFVLLDRDIMQVPPELILATQVLSTYVGGRPVFQRPTTP
ncbi:MAG: N-substituted formamide deformylase [Gemmatimonadaceae bacterium]|nr:N-substituted formamide deformylase [Gemmatimonadaceae bacterium]